MVLLWYSKLFCAECDGYDADNILEIQLYCKEGFFVGDEAIYPLWKVGFIVSWNGVLERWQAFLSEDYKQYRNLSEICQLMEVRILNFKHFKITESLMVVVLRFGNAINTDGDVTFMQIQELLQISR